MRCHGCLAAQLPTTATVAELASPRPAGLSNKRLAGIDHILANVDSADHGGDPEGVHQLRVGIRRLRSALSTFREIVPQQDGPSLSEELRWLQQELGPAREWDVLLGETFEPVMKRIRVGDGMQRLKTAAEARRGAAYERGRAVLLTPRYTDLLLRLEAWIDGDFRNQTRPVPDGEPNPLDQPVTGFAASALAVRHAKVVKLGRKVRRLDDAELHALRIRVKKLRYAAEFFRGLWPKKATKRYIAALKVLQNLLGTAHDAMVVPELIGAIETEAGTGAEREIGVLLGWSAAHLKHDRRRLVSLWDGFAELSPFWKNR